MDFIEKLLSFFKFDTILVIVNWLTKQVIFIPAHDTISSTDLACLFVLYVFSKHSVPSHVISSRGSEFVSNFFQSLGTALDMQLHFTLGYHPEGNGQTKCTNQTFEQYLHIYCNYQQDNWSKFLLFFFFLNHQFVTWCLIAVHGRLSTTSSLQFWPQKTKTPLICRETQLESIEIKEKSK